MPFQKEINEHIEVAQQMVFLQKEIAQIGQVCKEAIDKGGKIILAGNGGSAADAQHIAAELVGRFVAERNALPALALTTDTSILTSVGNDFGYEYIFQRQIQGLGNQYDVFIGISTSGNSGNIIKAVEEAKKKGIYCVGLLGKGGGTLKELVDFALTVPSENTQRIQEMHILIGHLICGYVESEG